MFFCEYCKILKNRFFYRTLQEAASRDFSTASYLCVFYVYVTLRQANKLIKKLRIKNFWCVNLRLIGCLYEVKHITSGISHLSEIPAESCISLSKNRSFLWEWIHLTQVRSHLSAGEISLRWDDFSRCKQFLPGCPTQTGLLFSLKLVCFYN